MSHTPTPWSLATDMRGISNVEVHGITSEYGDVANCGIGQVGLANAKHIVKCVNAHDDLVAACMAALRAPNIYDTDQQSGETPESLIRAALAKVAA